jgi:ankyrin repeat protein
VAGVLMDKSGALPGTAGSRQLQDAVLRGQADMVALLLDKGADPNQRTPSGGALLHDAALKGHRDIVQLLIGKGARVNERNASGATPLHDAALGGHLAVVELLLKKGADFQALDSETGATPLFVAASWGRIDVVRALLDAGADRSRPNKSGITPANAALANGHSDVSDLLRRYITPRVE